MKRRLVQLTVAAAGLALVGFLLAASGVVPIKASSGHWAITEWFLRFSMKRSTATHSLAIEAPPLNDPALVLKGAGHYEIGCRSCHGAPGRPAQRIAKSMTPTPPALDSRIRESTPERLFHVVKHGIKFTGMPAWPTQQRDDEVWAMVAFLLKLPGMDAGQYRALVEGDGGATQSLATLAEPANVPSAVLQTCARCHGPEGAGRGAAFPRLAGQRAEYLENALVAYARDMRHSGIMAQAVSGLDDATKHQLARYYAGRRPPSEPPTEVDAQAAERGEAIATNGIPRQRVPACVECHGAEGKRRKPAYPILDGQDAAYLRLQLELFKAGRRGGSEYAHLMEPVVTRLTDEQIREVAQYFAGRPKPNSGPAK